MLLNLLLEVFLIQKNVHIFDIPCVVVICIPLEESLFSLPLLCHFID
jgi:hypothetical protein